LIGVFGVWVVSDVQANHEPRMAEQGQGGCTNTLMKQTRQNDAFKAKRAIETRVESLELYKAEGGIDR